MDFRITGPSYIVLDFTDEVSAEYVAGLAKLIQQQGLPRLNGYYHKNNVDRPGYYLSVTYASKEMLRIQAEGTPSDTCVFAMAPLLDYAAKQKQIAHGLIPCATNLCPQKLKCQNALIKSGRCRPRCWWQ